ncbi:MAG: YajQ family cyclic di-GMP-binding protein [Acidimicrobiia bacterium]|nr:YajQ family cyclic di-GMP-binding protein [Acidimicrobiia bacterium]NNF64715.1 YajQ family cyclic di-GMP-binding protein [Acidimicrobiia bacterium]
MPTFDVVSQVDMQEVKNAVDQANRELVNRFDFKGTNTTIEESDEGITIESSAEGRLEAAVDVLKTKLVKRGVSLKSLSGGEIQTVGGGRVKAVFTLNQGLPQDAAKELSKFIRDTKLKVQAQIQGDQLRIQGKKRDDLQAVIAELKGLNFRLPLQYVNMRD